MASHRFGDHVRGTGATYVHAQDFIGLAWANTFTMPSVSMLARARPLALNGKLPLSRATPSALSVPQAPTPATSGQV